MKKIIYFLIIACTFININGTGNGDYDNIIKTQKNQKILLEV